MERKYRIPNELINLVTPGAIVVRSPGRINLIGEHTDYNEGFVLPGAIDKAVYVSIEKNNSDLINLYSVDFNESIEIRITEIRPIPGHWATYILGVVAQLKKKGYACTGFNLTVYGDVPLGAGLSSSAAIECSTAFALNELFAFGIDRMELARISQSAEHEYAKVMCGIMDQFASLFGKAGHVIRLDCRTLDYEYIPFDPKGYQLVLFDSKVKHALASSEYNIRRAECEEGVTVIKQKYPGVRSLRDVSAEMIDECLGEFETIYRRCKYVVDENARLEEGCHDLERGDLISFGKKMFATHEGLRTQYEVSCEELDLLIDAVKNIPEVIGARMMGGGFGGCTINIIQEGAVERIKDIVAREYLRKTGNETATYIVQINDGTSIIDQ